MESFKDGLKVDINKKTPKVRIIEGANNLYQVGDKKPVGWLGLTPEEQRVVIEMQQSEGAPEQKDNNTPTPDELKDFFEGR